jgi:UDP-N-acetylmuramoyl-L-alanyl-D-glutamate--2,6-diaminopimelate ligase
MIMTKRAPLILETLRDTYNSLASHTDYIKSGDLFVCMSNSSVQANKLIVIALNKGAKGVLIDSKIDIHSNSLPIHFCDNLIGSRQTLRRIFYPNIEQDIYTVGITGTNGKSTIVSFRHQLLTALGEKSSTIGTLGYHDSVNTQKATWTTPDDITLSSIMNDIINNDCHNLTMEISSHALAQDRIKTKILNQYIFTNLSQDHLDYHINMQHYLESKQRIDHLLKKGSNQVIANIDTPWFQPFFKQTNRTLFTVSTKQRATLHARNIKRHIDGIECDICYGDLYKTVLIPIYGEHNLNNLLCAIASLIIQGFCFETILNDVSDVHTPDGRLNGIQVDGQTRFFIDYAHTPDALEVTLKSLQSHFPEYELGVCFGCGGDRDQSKRKLMGKIASQYSQYVVLTSDNPRSELPEDICKQIAEGIPDDYYVITDRSKAIKNIVNWTRLSKNHISVIAGKGHECFQKIGNKLLSFNDKVELQKCL